MRREIWRDSSTWFCKNASAGREPRQAVGGARGAGRGNKVVGGTDAAPCAAMGGARRRPLQNSQRVLLAMARERGRRGAGCKAAHRAMRRGGAMGTSRPTATGPYDNGTGRRGTAQGERATGPCNGCTAMRLIKYVGRSRFLFVVAVLSFL